jgi:hypothetical protein
LEEKKVGRTYFRIITLLLISIVMASGIFLIDAMILGAEATDLSTSSTQSGSIIDTAPPTFTLLSPSEDVFQRDPYQKVEVQIADDSSGVDASSIEYRITTQGLSRWSQWLPYKDANDDLNIVVTLKDIFRRGGENYVQVRARDLAGNPAATSRPFNIKINSYPVILIESPIEGEILTEGTPIIFDASETYDPDGDMVQFRWFRSTPTGMELMGESGIVCLCIPDGEHTITLTVSDDLQSDVMESFKISVIRKSEKIIPDKDQDMDGIPDHWEIRFQTDPNIADSQMDSDNDGHTNLEEFQSHTNPLNKMSKPVSPAEHADDRSLELFSIEAWPLWIIFSLVVISVILTMGVVRVKSERQLKRLNTVQRKLRTTPSVSWEEVVTTAYIVPLNSSMKLRVLRGRGRQAALPPPKPVEQRLPPAEIEKREQLPAHTEFAVPEPEVDVHLSQAGTIPPPNRKTAVRKNFRDLCVGSKICLPPMDGNRIFGNGIRNPEQWDTVPKPTHSATRSPRDLGCDHDFSLDFSSNLTFLRNLSIPYPLILEEDGPNDHLIRKKPMEEMK